MPSPKAEWREFQELVARIEADADAHGLTVNSPDRIVCKLTGRLREVDASIRARVGTSSILVTIECRKRSRAQDITWIEQLASKKASIGADRTIAVSSSGFSEEAKKFASNCGIDLRKISDVTVADLNAKLLLDFVLFWHKRSAVHRVGIRYFVSDNWTPPDPEKPDYVVPRGTDCAEQIFSNNETGESWSIGDLWSQLQEATEPFAGIQKFAPPVLRTACFPYPGNVVIRTPEGHKRIGDVLLTVALWLECEQVTLENAKKVEYSSDDGVALHRVEFASPEVSDWRISMQMPKNATDLSQMKPGGNWPNRKR